MTVLVGSHRMSSDDGRTFIVYEYQERVGAGTKDDPYATIPGMSFYQLDNGMRVNFIDDDTFKIVQNGLVIRRSD